MLSNNTASAVFLSLQNVRHELTISVLQWKKLKKKEVICEDMSHGKDCLNWVFLREFMWRFCLHFVYLSVEWKKWKKNTKNINKKKIQNECIFVEWFYHLFLLMKIIKWKDVIIVYFLPKYFFYNKRYIIFPVLFM